MFDILFIVDFLLILAMLGIGSLSMMGAYHFGGKVWQTRFRLKYVRRDGRRGSRPGQYGEFANLAMILFFLFLVNRLTPTINIVDLFVQHWGIMSAAGVGVVALVLAYTIYTTRSYARSGRWEHTISRADHARLLTRGYVAYFPYCTIVVSAMILIVVLLVLQFINDFTSYRALYAEIDHIFRSLRNAAMPVTSLMQVKFEVIFGKTSVAGTYIVDQMNTILVALFCAFTADIIVSTTPLKNLYERSALIALRTLTIILSGAAVVAGFIIFFTLHVTFIDSVRSWMAEFEPIMNTGPWDITMRYHEMTSMLSKKRGIMGFLLELTTERGGLILILPAVQWLLNKSRKPDSQPAAA